MAPNAAATAKRLLLLVASLACVLGAAELALRILGGPQFLAKPHGSRPWKVSDPVLGWRNKAGFENWAIRINTHGYRGPEVAPRSARSDRPRILCVGDSGTFGIWVDRRAGRVRARFRGYPQVLRQLTALNDLAEVINTGVAGYTSSNGLRLFATEGVRLEPDVAVVRFGVNDHRRSHNPNRRVQEPRSRLLRAALYRLYDVQLVRLGLEAWTMSPVHPEPGTVPWVALERFEENIRRFGEIARAHEIDLLLVDTPLRPLERGESSHASNVYRGAGYPSLAAFHDRHGDYQLALRRVADEEGIALLETRSRLQSRPRFFSDFDFVHPNDDGARVIAMAVLRELLQRGWVTAAQPSPAAPTQPGLARPSSPDGADGKEE